MPGPPRHVIWDWNGTLVDDFGLILEAASACCEALRGAPIDADEYRTHFTRPVQAFYERVVGRPLSALEWEQVNQTFHQRYLDRLEDLVLVPTAAAALEGVRHLGISQSVLSMWQQASLVGVIDRLGIAEFFVAVRGKSGMDGGDDHKAEHLVSHLGDLEGAGVTVDPAEVLLVGDSLDDAAAAAAVGARCVLVEGGSHHSHHLATAGVPVVGSLVAALHVAGLPVAPDHQRAATGQ
ncbi:MAG TPA: HAD family hydrolase [Acidimicrobiales bacterium]|nr:HAD family hydrolase [Acidimicrobiales bacterium]